MTSFFTLKEEILDLSLCTSCGLCASVCPQGLLAMNGDSVPLPVFQGMESQAVDTCGSCNLCSEVCPGYDTGVMESERRIFGRNRSELERWTGIYLSTYQLSAADPEILGRAAAGGAATILAITALEENLADAVIVVGRDQERPWVPKAYLADSVDRIIECAQTSYCITPNLDLLKDGRYDKIGIIGVPCQIQGINKLLNLPEHLPSSMLAGKVAFTIELGCASNTSLGGTEHLITEILGIDLADVVFMRYREGQYPGQFVVRTRQGQEHYLPFYRLVEEFKKFKTFRCLACPDWWSGVADISISDGDPNIFDSSKAGVSAKASSTVMVRTRTGADLLALALRRNAVELVDYIFENNLGLERKRQRYRSYAAKGDRRIPLAPGRDMDYSQILSDDEVIRIGIGTEQGRATGQV
ncbi:Coenzyme F420 hydrogenase/dehydrogenase, beta subunit C-terminal domain [Paenibacillus sp. P46E]|uniref:Coenzyme F420 hydrogenase/dehydrogenase, beta subunit C-terminal domain n=1 Tax=Paenibacillus sp. P46E TaxID=1349436 RepID=UPI00093B5E38|nr:Coenzyme F420 hydrogenase/dehydrogenase, beta subunit C-terminal domain [Paenibacillus sp. P46E]OKP98071.1 hypothetical protein A3849_11840 [Paenibacillus sp. P46E]